MKLETVGNVIGFPDVNVRNAHAIRRAQGARPTGEESEKNGFLSLLRTNVENAEQLLLDHESAEERNLSDAESSRREEMLDIPFFGTLLGAVATKMASTSLQDGQVVQNLEMELSERSEITTKSGPRMISGQENAEVSALHRNRKSDFAVAEEIRHFQHSKKPENAVEILEVSGDETRKTLSLKDGNAWRGVAPVKSQFLSHDTISMNDESTPVAAHDHKASVKSAHGADLSGEEQSSPDENRKDASASAATFVEGMGTSGKASERTPSQQIADNIKAAIPLLYVENTAQGSTKSGTIRFKLHPENLGEIEVSLKMTGDKVEVSLVLERMEAARAISATQDDLRAGLSDQGLTLDLVDVSVGKLNRDVSPGPSGNQLPQSGQQSQNYQTNAGSFGAASQGRPGSYNRSATALEDENGNIQRQGGDRSARILRSGLYL